MTTTAVAYDSPTLIHADDRCDRCSAAGHVLVLLHNGGDLVFCQHHANKFRAGLEPIAVIIERPEELAR